MDTEIPEVGTKFRNPSFPRKVFAFISETRKGDILYWSFIDVNSGKARFFHPDEVVMIDEKPKRKPTQRAAQKKKRPDVEGKSKTITVDGDSVTVI